MNRGRGRGRRGGSGGSSKDVLKPFSSSSTNVFQSNKSQRGSRGGGKHSPKLPGNSGPIRKSLTTPTRNSVPSDMVRPVLPPLYPAAAVKSFQLQDLTVSDDSFLQDGTCVDKAPNLEKCRECASQVSIGNTSSLCKFNGFRKLKYTKNGSLAFAGFSDPTNDPSEDDVNLWLPSKDTRPEALEFEMAKFVVGQLGGQFCDLIQEENQVKEISLSTDKELVAWKRVGQGVREMCDICDTTLFNYHWTCKKCGFVVCVACYKERIQEIYKKVEEQGKRRDELQGLFCTNRQVHEFKKLMLTQTIPGDALTVLGEKLHRMRAAWNIPQDCGCEEGKKQQGSNIKGVEPNEKCAPVAVIVIPEGEHSTSTQESNSETGDSEGRFQLKEHQASRRGKVRPPVKTYFLEQTAEEYQGVPHSWLCSGKLLHLHDSLHSGNQKLFQEVWKRGLPVIVSHISDRLNKTLWSVESFSKNFSELKNDLVDCLTGRLLRSQPMEKFWEGFEYVNKRLKDENGNPMLLKLKDWPPAQDFAEFCPERFKDLMANLPLRDYTNRSGWLNLASRLPDGFVKPDLGPKMYIAYGAALHSDKGTTNLHLDISDAVNLMVHVGLPKDVSNEDEFAAVLKAIEQSDADGATVDRVKEKGDLPGALWHIYNARDADTIRDLLNKIAVETGMPLDSHHDPIHDQTWYLDKKLRQRLREEYNVVGYSIIQFMGDAVFIPAGAPHQVKNLHNCIKIAEDFVSPENVSHCFHLTEEFRHLTDTHSNHEDKLQIKNIMYHAVKDALSVLLYQNEILKKRKACDALQRKNEDEHINPPKVAKSWGKELSVPPVLEKVNKNANDEVGFTFTKEEFTNLLATAMKDTVDYAALNQESLINSKVQLEVTTQIQALEPKLVDQVTKDVMSNLDVESLRKQVLSLEEYNRQRHVPPQFPSINQQIRFKCTVASCGSNFACLGNLNRHLRQKHQPPQEALSLSKENSCRFCARDYPKNWLTRHENTCKKRPPSTS